MWVFVCSDLFQLWKSTKIGFNLSPLLQQKEPWLDDTWSVNLRSVLSDKSGSPPTEQQVKLTGFETTTKEVVSIFFYWSVHLPLQIPHRCSGSQLKLKTCLDLRKDNLQGSFCQVTAFRRKSAQIISERLTIHFQTLSWYWYFRSATLRTAQVRMKKKCVGHDFHRTQFRSLPWPLSYWLIDSLC